ncbi:MAG: dephospho-CoA kinase [Candidatus Dadabacteria bacterium RIFCSPHIGHO2_12_FULL_53_21]|nr:MAG: dephospho-CoA kinase [Candidatus Dadabacteria bacterium RIFCSPHIGHO2_12_FULL_53_21]
MKVIGITGNIASGKSTVARMFEALGARIIDADEIARIVVEPGEPAWKEIVGEFGKDILEPGGAIDRKRLGDIVFGDEARRKRLNEITHPRIMERIRGLVRGYEKEKAPVVMIEAALIVEKGGLKDLIDALIVVTADEETQIRRLMEGKGYSREEAVSRLRAQMPAREKMIHGDYIIDNSGSLEDTRARAKAVSEAIGF